MKRAADWVDHQYYGGPKRHGSKGEFAVSLPQEETCDPMAAKDAEGQGRRCMGFVWLKLMMKSRTRRVLRARMVVGQAQRKPVT